MEATPNLGTTATDVLDVKDRRKDTRQAKHPLVLDREALDIAAAVAGVDLAGCTIKVRIKDGDAKAQGQARRIGPNAFLVTLRVAKKDAYLDRHHYVVNNSLVHELRHVAQMQADPNFAQNYSAETMAKGYQANPYEVEARYFGRLADHTGTKDTGPAGKALGTLVWAVRFA